MSPSTSREGSPQSAQLTVRAGSPLAEIFLIDQDFVLTARSVGDFNAEVPAGVYKVKAKLADATVERLVLLEDDETLDISNELVIGSPVPLAEASVDGALESLPVPDDREAPRMEGRTQIMLMTRTEMASGDTPVMPPRISLHTPSGSPVGSLEPEQGRLDYHDSTVIEVNPGAFFARRQDRFGDAAEQCVYAVDGWQTQLFTLEQQGDDDEIGRIRVSVLMSRDGFDPSNPELHTVEEARTALACERKIASKALAELCETTENPMLALFGAHLMLIGRDTERRENSKRDAGRLDENAVTAPVQFEQARFDRIVDRLTGALGPEHADVVALATQRTGQSLDALPPIGAPPMLWRSWILLVAASNDVPALVPTHTWLRTLHVLPLRPFFLWAPVENPRVSDSLKDSIAVGMPRDSSEQSEADDELRRRLSDQLIVPRGAIDQFASNDLP